MGVRVAIAQQDQSNLSVDGSQTKAAASSEVPFSRSEVAPVRYEDWHVHEFSEPVGGSPPLSNTGGGKFALTARLLVFDADSIYWYVKVSESDLANFKAKLEAGNGPECQLAMYRLLGYAYQVVPEMGLRVLVAPDSNLAMGLYVIAGPRWLRTRDVSDLEPAISRLLAGWGFDVQEIRLSRVDLAADVLGQGKLPDIDVRQELVTRARRRTPHYDGADFTGFDCGTGAIRFRLYDKTIEAADDLDFWSEVWQYRPQWGAETVARFEWQLRRPFLEEFGVDTVGELVDRLGDVMRYLLDWVRLAGPSQGHEHERPDLPVWAFIRQAVSGLRLQSLGLVRWKAPKPVNVARLAEQAAGVLISMACGLGLNRGLGRPVGQAEAMRYLTGALQACDWAHRADERWQRVQLAAMMGA